MIRLTMLPARDGDCLLLEYGHQGSMRRILIDGGRAGTYPDIRPTLEEQAKFGGTFDLLVITHVDQDHIMGVLGMLADARRPVGFADVWFNGYRHLVESPTETFGVHQGELLSTALVAQRLSWNGAFEGKAARVGREPIWPADGGRITLLSPDTEQLAALEPDWSIECDKNGLIEGRPPIVIPPGFEAFGPIDIDDLAKERFEPDDSKPNRTSIAFLFEFDSVRIMFTGDADPRRLVDSIRDLAEQDGGRLQLDALKVPHHGSRMNISKELLDLIDCKRFLISTSGSRHPDPVAMARILKFGGAKKELVFNYDKPAARWDIRRWKQDYGYSVTRPAADGIVTVDTWQ